MIRRTLFLVVVALLTPFTFADSLSTGTVNDPTLNNIKAFTVSIPSGWKFQGTVVRGPQCDPMSAPIFRAYSPDGLTEIRLEPMFAWSFHPAIKMATVQGCMPYKSTMSASEFLDRYLELIAGGVHVVGPMAIAPTYRERVEKFASALNANNQMPGFHATVDTAALRIETHNGTFTIEQRLRVWVECRTNTGMGKFNGGGCSAHVDVLRAPKGKLDALVNLVDANDLTKTRHEDPWLQAVMARQQQEGRDAMRRLTQTEQQQQAMIRTQYEQIQETMNRNHQAFMQQQEASFQSSMRNANNAMIARTTAASDWVDYSLDQKTVAGSNGLAKVSTDYEHVWSDGHNNWYLAHDPNTNPNGVLPGNWSEDQKVHGNGQPY